MTMTKEQRVRELVEAAKSSVGDFHCQECGIYPQLPDAILAVLDGP